MMKSWMKALMIFKFQLKPIYNIFLCTRLSNRWITPIPALYLNQDRHFLQCAATPERAPFTPPPQGSSVCHTAVCPFCHAGTGLPLLATCLLHPGGDAPHPVTTSCHPTGHPTSRNSSSGLPSPGTNHQP